MLCARRAAARAAAALRRHPHRRPSTSWRPRTLAALAGAAAASATSSPTRRATGSRRLARGDLRGARWRSLVDAALRRCCSARSRRAGCAGSSDFARRSDGARPRRSRTAEPTRSDTRMKADAREDPCAAARGRVAARAGARACGSSDDSSSSSAARAVVRVGPRPAGQGQAGGHDRRQELHRAVHPRRALRAGAARQGLHGERQVEHRLLGDHRQGADRGKIDMYPEYTGVILSRARRTQKEQPERTRTRPTTAPRSSRRAAASRCSTRRRSSTPTRSRSSRTTRRRTASPTSPTSRSSAAR